MNPSASHSDPELKQALACPLCGAGREFWDLNAEVRGAGPYTREVFSIYRCRRCTIGITDPVPQEGDSHQLYNDRTSFDFQDKDSSLAAALKRMVAVRDARAFVSGVHLCKPAARMLDYGCGNGSFAISMRAAFPNGVLLAADYHAEAPPSLAGSDVRYARYDELPAQSPFDFILCRHVLEHTYKPVEFLRSMGRLMSPGGVLMMEVPNVRAPLRRIFGKSWDLHYVPYHPIHFSLAALRRAVADSGLVAEKTGGWEMPEIGRSLRNVINCEYNAVLFGVGVLLHPVQVGARLLTREPTCLRLWARKV